LAGIKKSGLDRPTNRSAALQTDMSKACEFLNESLDGRIQMDLDELTVEEFLKQRNLAIHRVLGDGHCLLHSWCRATNSSMKEVKRRLLKEYNEYQREYEQADISLDDLKHYLRDRSYQLNSVDAVIEMLSNAFEVTVFIVGQKYDYSDPDPTPVDGKMEIKRIGSQAATRSILLHKDAAHYNCIESNRLQSGLIFYSS